jgi:hypothetical protein
MLEQIVVIGDYKFMAAFEQRLDGRNHRLNISPV